MEISLGGLQTKPRIFQIKTENQFSQKFEKNVASMLAELSKEAKNKYVKLPIRAVEMTSNKTKNSLHTDMPQKSVRSRISLMILAASLSR